MPSEEPKDPQAPQEALLIRLWRRPGRQMCRSPLWLLSAKVWPQDL